MPASANSAETPEFPDSLNSESAKELTLKSPFGVAPKIYSWPLKKGRGSLRKSEDKQDEAAEILESIKYVCEEHPEIHEVIMTTDIFSKTDMLSFESMLKLCTIYNTAVDKMISTNGLPFIEHRKSRASRPHLKHILQQCYNSSVEDPNELNHYEPFTPEVYGETSFELICQIIDKLHPISDDNKFIDLGSGVGQVVLQFAALTNCQISVGIEKAKAPAKYAREMKSHFEFWMKWYGKIYSEFQIIEGDFLDTQFREKITSSTIIFVNNFAFGPVVDLQLKGIFADLVDGSRIFSSKSFCALNFRISDRNLSDIGTIMHVSKMDPLKGSVSWTGKPVSYFLHIIDRAKLERFFQKSAARKDGDNKKNRRMCRNLNHGLDESSSGSRDDSRASSIEHEDPTIDSGTRNGSEDEDLLTQPRVSLKKKGRRLLTKKRSSSDESIPNQVEHSSDNHTDSSTPPPSESSSSASRPVRAAVVNAAAISVAQLDMELSPVKKGRMKKKPVASGRSGNQAPVIPTLMGRKKTSRPGQGNAALDLLHKATLESIDASNLDETAPTGCVSVRLQIDQLPEMVHEELPVSLNTDYEGREIPLEFRMFLEKMKRQYLEFMERMQSESYKKEVEREIYEEQQKNQEWLRREKQLKSQIDNLISDTLALLKKRLDELGIQAKTPPEFIEKAKMIVSNHHELQRNKASIETEIAQLEKTQAQIVARKEQELLDLAMKKSPGLTKAEAQDLVRKKIDTVLKMYKSNVSQESNKILGLSSEVIVTKCPADQLPVSTQIRKRTRDSKQKDWPEKKSRDLPASIIASPIKSFDHEKLEEKSPELLAKKIIEQGRSLERSKAVLSPRQSVEVRKIEIKTEPLKPEPRLPGRSEIVDLPRMEMNMSLSLSSSMAPLNEHPSLVFPPHPTSRSGSTDPNDDVSFGSQKMNSTPRAEQFEDRLKTIIQSELARDGTGRPSPPPAQRPMFSPVKKELPSHLPLPPSGIVPSMSHYPQMDMKLTTDLSAYPQTNSSRTMNDLIASEIEKNLTGNSGSQSSKPYHPDYVSAGPFGGPPGNSSTGMTRMSQVIEDSLRGNHDRTVPRPPMGTKELEGLALPRTMSPYGRHERPSSRPHEFPVEGLAARFGPQRAVPPQGPAPAHSAQDLSSSYSRPAYGGPPYPEQLTRKRASPQMSPVLPPKKQLLEGAHSEMKNQEPDNSQQQKWQDEISSGFDRLVAYATSIDESRRRSTEDPNPESVDTRISTLSMKFKGNLKSGFSTYGSSNRAVSSISPDNFDSSSNPDTLKLRSPLPGENLPEHHFKKRYFAETRDFGSSKTESSSSYSPNLVQPKKRFGEDSSTRSASPPLRNSSHGSTASSVPLRENDEDARKTNSPASSSSVLDSTTGDH